MMHPHTRLAYIGDRTGFGVVATQPIPRGTIVWVRDALDQRIAPGAARALGPLFEPALRHHAFWEEDTDLILCWDHARYVNHSCDANCLGGGFEFELAVRDIAPGEELTDDYATFGYATEFPCACGAPSCRGRMSRADAPVMAPIWDGLLLAALTDLEHVEQPLWPLVRDKERVRRVLVDHTLPVHRVA